MKRVPLHSFQVTLSEPAPPSSNHLYVNGMHGRRVLSAAGRAFKDALTSAVAAECAQQAWKDAIAAVYEHAAWVRVRIILRLPIYNASWKPNSRTRKGNVRSPYVQVDGTNYTKAIEDAVKQGTGVDDSAHLDVRVIKRDHPGPFHVEVHYSVFARKKRKATLQSAKE